MIGRTISHYKIVDKIGQGGMGVVYKAHDVRLNRPVALKFLRAEALDEADRQRFIREAQNAAALNHPNICTIYEIDHCDGETFLSMAWLEGENLAQRIQANPLSIIEATGIAKQIASGLEAAHQQGIVHRDVKSPNVIIMPDGLIKILDFGLAEVCGRTVSLPGTLTGTPTSMSPEQIQGQPVDFRSDIWSWGVVFYEMLTGRLPFVGDELALLTNSILMDQPRKPSDLNSLVPPVLDDVVMKALAKDVDARFQSATEIVDALSRISESFDSQAIALEETVELLPADTRPSIAVLSFADMSEHKDQQYFCDGIAEEIINQLSRIPVLRVASRTSSFAFRDQSLDVREIGQRLGVKTVLEGSLRKAADDLRITCQLIGVSHGYQLWSQQFDRKLQDVFFVQEQIARSVADALKLELTESDEFNLGKAATNDLEAYEFYLRGREFFYGARHKTIRFALDMFNKATEKDPGFSRAYAGIADCHSYLFMHFGGRQEDLDLALDASQKALELDPNLGEGHAASGFALSLNNHYQEAQEAFEAAIKLNPNLFEAWYLYARMCFAQKEYVRAAQLFEKACEVCPASFQAPLLLAMTYKSLGESNKAMTTYARGLQLAEAHLDLHPDDSRAYYLAASALAELGEKEKSIKFAERALEIDPEDAAITYGIACLHGQFGNVDMALDYLERAIEAGFGHKDWIENDPDLNSVNKHPRFSQVLSKIQPI